MSVINALVNLDCFLRTLKLDRDQHGIIQMHVEKVRQAAIVETQNNTNQE